MVATGTIGFYKIKAGFLLKRAPVKKCIRQTIKYSGNFTLNFDLLLVFVLCVSLR